MLPPHGWAVRVDLRLVVPQDCAAARAARPGAPDVEPLVRGRRPRAASRLGRDRRLAARSRAGRRRRAPLPEEAPAESHEARARAGRRPGDRARPDRAHAKHGRAGHPLLSRRLVHLRLDALVARRDARAPRDRVRSSRRLGRVPARARARLPGATRRRDRGLRRARRRRHAGLVDRGRGDSAGGNLAIELQLALRDRGGPQAAAAVLLSPWVDLTMPGASFARNDPFDFGTREVLVRHAAAYAGGAALDDPRVSPRFADLAGLAPVFITAGEVEIPRDDIEAFAQKLRAAGVETTFHLAADMPHNAAFFADFHPSGAAVIDAVRKFVAARTSRREAGQ
ncbi:MAG: alpha/beta hydrolase fold domain-containing protein [Polyangiaceae bacterium]